MTTASTPAEGESKIDLFQKQEIRKVYYKGEWWFAVVDVIKSLTESADPSGYISDMRRRDSGFAEAWGQIATPLPIQTTRGIQDTNCTNTEGVFRIMQSVPSPKAEPFKKWLAKNAFERLQEIKDPELVIKRAITIYRAKGYDDGWIDARIRNKVSRETLTAEWRKRGVGDYYGLLTDAISVQTFGISTADHKKIKSLKSQSLRDNMTPIELTLTTLGEQAATQITRATNAQGLRDNKAAADQGGRIAGGARRELEKATGEKVVSTRNYLTQQQRVNNFREAEFDDIMSRLLEIPAAREQGQV